MTQVITQTEAARIAGVTQSAIAHLRESGHWAFFVDSRIDTNHPSWQVYLRGRHVFRAPDPDPDEDDEYDEDDEDEEKRIYKEVDLAYKKARAKKEQENARKIEIQRKRLEGQVIELQYVESIFFQYLGLLHKQFLNMPNQLVDRIQQIAQSGADNSRQEIVDLWSREVEQCLKQTKDETKRNLLHYMDSLEK